MFNRSTSLDESEIPESFVNTISGFRVSVCLQRYFKDVRNKCYLQVTPNRSVRWLEKRIQKLFALSGNFCLLTNGHFLPSSEPLALLNPDDFIEVIPLPDVNEKVAIKNSEKNKCNVDPHNKSYSQYKTNLSGKWNTCSEIFTSDKNLQNVEINGENTFNTINEDHVDGVETSKTIEDKNTIVNDTGAEGLYNHDVDDSTQSLLNLKRKALTILDLISTDKDERETEEGSCAPPRRTRRRVRHRRRRAADHEHDSTERLDREAFALEEPQISPRNTPTSVSESVETLPALDMKAKLQDTIVPRESGSSKEPERDTHVSQSLLQEVTRNETIHSRKPRVVHSLNE